MSVVGYIMAGALALSLVGCASTSTSINRIPVELLDDCLPTKVLKTETNADLSDSLAEVASTLKACNIDKRKLREWATESSR